MDFVTANKTVYLEKFATFSGRASRSEFWWSVLFCFVVSVVLTLIDPTQMLAGIFTLIILIPSLAVGVRRLHDSDMSGWWLLMLLIPLIGFIFWIYMGVKPGTEGPNRFDV